ncbi:MAG: MinD/ParA family protein, partial [Rhizobacter sp.]
AVSLADDVLVLATPEPTSMTDAYATIKVLATQQQRHAIRLVVNQVGRVGEGKVIRNQLQLVVDKFVVPLLPEGSAAPVLELTGEVPLDPAVREAVQKRQLLVEMLPGSAAAQAVDAIAARVAP